MLSQISILPSSARASQPPAANLGSAMRDVLSVESDFVSKFLPYREMTQIPPGYQDFVQWHFRRLTDDSVRWQDAAPAYALACLSHAAYGTVLDPSVEWELELQWADLKGLSRLSWPSARRLILDAWIFLTGNDQLPAGLDTEIDARAASDPAWGAGHGSLLPDEEDDGESAELRVGTELVPAYIVLRESMAERNPAQWKTRGQEHWLSANVPAICLAMSPALAVLETLTYQGFLDDEPRTLVRLAFPPAALRNLESTIEGWQDRPQRDDPQKPADRWALEQRSPLLQVPSALCPGEFNVLANLLHPEFSMLQRIDTFPMNMDRRKRRN